MTSATTILGMLPLAMSKGSGSELWSPMGIAVIGGLVFSTVVTLVLVPVIYASFAKRGERNRHIADYKELSFLNGDQESIN
jgi:HAE1 family hydrophobic/amphiphilic exporter-1